MKKRLLSQALALIVILLSLASCSSDSAPTATPSVTPSATTLNMETVKNDFILSYPTYVYNSFLFYPSVNYSNPNKDTLKYQNLNNPQENGVSVYNDAFGGEDPFVGISNIDIVVDEEATKNNGGMPVLIISKSYSEIDIATGQNSYVARIIRFDQGSNKLTEIFKNESGMRIDGMCLYGNTLYFKSWDRDSQEEYSFAYHSMNKNGGEVTTYDYTGYVTSYMGIYKDTMYFHDSISGKVISTDLSHNNDQTIMSGDSASNAIMLPKITGRYMYFIKDIREIDLDGNKVKVGDLCRKSLDDFDKAETETVIEGVAESYVNGKYIAYSLGSEAELEEVIIEGIGDNPDYTFAVNRIPIIRVYDIETKKDKIAIDNTKDPNARKHSTLWGIEGDYIVMGIENPDSEYMLNNYYNIETGKSTILSFYSE